ncbi:hypothetical protein NQD34_015496 [Periophthalmus magnuspinnatus]|nr:hypothetical protein NQD34_015496 [Periophthalmus magnuspinnatus]
MRVLLDLKSLLMLVMNSSLGELEVLTQCNWKTVAAFLDSSMVHTSNSSVSSSSISLTWTFGTDRLSACAPLPTSLLLFYDQNKFSVCMLTLVCDRSKSLQDVIWVMLY